MSEILKKPYEISIWEDRLITDGDESYYQEIKVAVIGTDTMDAPNRVYSPVLTENVNGEITLTFSLSYRYYDEMVGDFVVNPFAAYLVNERKVKLWYNDKWYDFIIKECEEDSEGKVFSYTATSTFVQELSKNGYGITFSTDLNNNQGTITELAEKTLKNTDWEVDKADSDLLQQLITEPIYKCTVTTHDFTALDLKTNEMVTIAAGETIYIFYSYINNKIVKYIQFLRESDKDNEDDFYDSNKWTYDSNDAIIGTNYRIVGNVSYTIDEETQAVTQIKYGNTIITIGQTDSFHQGYRLVYSQKITYDPVTERTVNIYEAKYHGGTQEIYSYEESEYGTSSAVTSYITNGTMASAYSGDTIVGWSNANMTSNSSTTFPKLEIVTEPPISTNTKLVNVAQMSNLVSYLRISFSKTGGRAGNWANMVYNTGFSDNASLIGSIAKGERYVLRFRGKAEGNSRLSHFKCVIAGYTYTTQTINNIAEPVKKIDPSKIYFEFDGSDSISNNYITGGTLSSDWKHYSINGVIQTPSRQYLYTDIYGRTVYYNYSLNRYALYPSSNYIDYFHMTAVAQKPMPASVISSSSDPIGIFFYSDNGAETYRIEEVQLFKYVPTKPGESLSNNPPVLPGSAPEAKVSTTTYYYLKPVEGTKKDDVNLYTSRESIADYLAIPENLIEEVRNENCEKVLSINEEKSNCFNILQTLCETFQCWLKINVEHEANGAIRLDAKTHKPIKKIAFKEYVGRDNFAGFKYGINLQSIQRSIDSNEFVSKLIVNQPTSEYTDSGVISIRDAKSNPSGESYILNFNYYINQKLIQNPDEFSADLRSFNEKLKEKNNSLNAKNKELADVKTAFTKVEANRSVYSSAYEAAQESYSQALISFENVTHQTYDAYVDSHTDAEILNDDTVASLIYDIYSYRIQVNNYGGLFSNLSKEYNTLRLKYKGAQEYGFTVSTSKTDSSEQTKLVLDDYIEGFECLFEIDGLATEWKSRTNDRDFVDSAHAFKRLIVTKVPTDYELQYLYDNVYITVTDVAAMQFDIYDSKNKTGMVRRFRLVPTASLIKDNIGLVKEIENIQAEKDALEKEFFAKYSYLIQEGTWESNDYIDPELYYLDALQVSNTSAQPKVSYQINVAEISEIEGFENYLFFVGDRTWIEDTEFFGWEVYSKNGVVTQTPIKEEVIVSQVEWHLDEPENNLVTVQNYKTQFEDLFQRISAAVQTVQYNQANYSRVASILDSNGRINAKLLVNSLNAISADTYELASAGIVKATNEGLIVRDLTNSGNLLIIKSRGIERSEDGGQTWENLISAKGVNTETLTSGSVDTQKITIIDGKDPSFRWDKNGLSAYGFNEDGPFDLKTFVRFDKYGIYGIRNNPDYVVSSLEDVKNNSDFGLTWDGFFIKNKYRKGYISISSTDDIQVVANNSEDIPVERIKIGLIEQTDDDEKYGIRISNDNGESVFETDDNGDISMTGTIHATGGEFTGRITAADGQIGGFEIGEKELYHGEFGEDQSIYLSTGHVSQKAIANYSGTNTWTIAIGNDFGVTESGTLYARGANISGTINAIDGHFSGSIDAIGGTFKDIIYVGNPTGKNIQIDARYKDPIIASSDYVDNTSAGWMINGYGDAIFNNISVRGAIKTAVFEYSEIQAVGGAFLFRPSSTIKNAWIANETDVARELAPESETITTNDLILVTEKILLFNQNEWVKVSNINDEDRVDIHLSDGGLTHVYRIKNNPKKDKIIVLDGAAADFASGMSEERTPIIINTEDNIDTTRINLEDLTDFYESSEDSYWEGIYSITLLDTTLVNNHTYYFEYDYRPLVKETKEAIVKKHITDEETREPIIIENAIIYMGNLAILDSDYENTGEKYLVATPVGGETTKVYFRNKESSCWFKIYKTEMVNTRTNLANLIGGSLISFGYHDNAYNSFIPIEGSNPHLLHLYELINGEYVITEDTEIVSGKIYYKAQYNGGSHNYGIGINSSDNYINLPERAISLFETVIHPTDPVKVTYDYKGILGTLPPLGKELASDLIYNHHMAGTQGIFTNNMYIGDNNQYIAFYTDDNGDKQLRIKAKRVMYEITDDQGQGTGEYKDVSEITEGADGEDAINVVIESSAGNLFYRQDISSTLTCTVYSGTKDITNQVTRFTWTKKNADGIIDSSWSRPLAGRSITLTEADVDSKAIFVCEVEF